MYGLRKHPSKEHIFWKIGDPVLTPEGPGEIRGFAEAISHGPARGEYRWNGNSVDGPFVVLHEGGKFAGYIYDQLRPRAGNERKWPGETGVSK